MDNKSFHGIITLLNSSTRWGWNIKSDSDLLLALEGEPYFTYVASQYIEEVLENCRHKCFSDIKELVSYISKNYI